MTKQEQLQALSYRVIRCRQCPHLVLSRTQTVFGTGNPDAEFMFVGEAPGKDEDRIGEPFVGRAGKFLTSLIRLMGFTRDQVYIANVLKCRPDAESGNRKPEAEEMENCLPFLKEQIQIIQPKVLIALGATALEGLKGKIAPISQVRGHIYDFHGTPLVPTFHPAYVLRNSATEVRSLVWRDCCRAMDLAGYDTLDRREWVPDMA
jgi:DNA polymerase